MIRRPALGIWRKQEAARKAAARAKKKAGGSAWDLLKAEKDAPDPAMAMNPAVIVVDADPAAIEAAARAIAKAMGDDLDGCG